MKFPLWTGYVQGFSAGSGVWDSRGFRSLYSTRRFRAYEPGIGGPPHAPQVVTAVPTGGAVLRFRDQDGSPIEDYSFVLGALVKGRPRPSRTVAHTHKNRAHPSHLTVLFNLKELE